ncbi:unnamed protein product [Taenia asiatica]|uniref:Uncharacterized protein n=1 Tax=Taenia asiatica TaxID=60517 RepID=A0A0R3VY91_TAEAS|nr:unnamed protein product [Taenia asiatica]
MEQLRRLDESKLGDARCTSQRFDVATDNWGLCGVEWFVVDGLVRYGRPSAEVGTVDTAVQWTMTSLTLVS